MRHTEGKMETSSNKKKERNGDRLKNREREKD